MPRLGYSKSRKGCLRCKQRRVKCDERFPACGACVRHNLPCSLGDVDTSINVNYHGGATAESVSQGGSPGSRTHTPLTNTPSPAQPSTTENADPFPYLSNLVRSQDESQDFRTWSTDLELMHNYTAVSWRTMPRAEEMVDIWQLQAPRIALTHDYLMHQILAISAAHLVHTHPDQHAAYSLSATQHQNRALQRLQGVLPDTNDANSPAIFLTASLLSIGAFAALSEPQTQGSSGPGVDDLLHVLLLLRGMYGILQGFHSTLRSSSIGKMIQAGERPSSSPLLIEIIDELTILRMIPAGGETLDPVAERALRDAMDEFMYWIRQASGSVELPELRVVMTWPTRLTDTFTALVRARNRVSLKVLACYARILEALGPTHWYLTGWGQSVLADINRSTL